MNEGVQLKYSDAFFVEGNYQFITIKMDENKNEYVTSEFPLAATLLSMQIKLIGIKPSKDDSTRMEFIFNKDQVIEKLIAGYWAGSLRIEPKHLWNQIRELKSRLKAQA